MFYRRLLIRTLRRLADIDGPFPMQNRHIILAAERYGFSDEVIIFLRQFPPHAIFTSRSDFIACCKQLEAGSRPRSHHAL